MSFFLISPSFSYPYPSSPFLVYPLFGLAIFVVGGWAFVWMMHILAILNAKLKLYRPLPKEFLEETMRIQETISSPSTISIHDKEQCVLMPPTPPLTPSPSCPSVVVLGLEETHHPTHHSGVLSTSVPPTPSSSYYSLPHQRRQEEEQEVYQERTCSSPAILEVRLDSAATHSQHLMSNNKNNNNSHHEVPLPSLLPSYSPLTPVPSLVDVSLVKKNEASSPLLPGVSIIKPLVGVDPYLASNLESFFQLKYPLFELLFCIHSADDPCQEIVHQLRLRYPSIPVKVFLGGHRVGTNPKINNMQPGYEAANHPLILISDSGILMKEDTLLDMVSSMDPDVALVHQMPYTCDRRGFPSILEKVYFGTAHARIYLSADIMGINCPTGMSALMRKSVLDEMGGIRAFAQYLAEDYFFAKSMTDKGWKIRISSRPALQNSETADVESFHARISRWAKLRFAMVPHTIVLEPLSECLILGVIASWAINFLFNVDPFAVYLFHALSWFLLDFTLLNIIQATPLPFSKTDFVAAWTFRELTALLVFLKALWDPNIRWRTGTYRLKWGGIAEEVKPKI